MKFSIICPVYNSEKYLDDCIRSVINQTYDNWEIILIDDGSTDLSQLILEKYISKSIFYFKHENVGPYMSRIEGILKATGDYILFLDSDDTYDAHLLQRLYDNLKIYPVDILGFGHNIINGNKIFKYNNLCNVKSIDIYREKLLSIEANSLCTKCFSKKLFKNIKSFPKTFSKMGEDLLFNLVLAEYAVTFRGISDCLYNFYVNNGSSTHSDVVLEKLNDKLNFDLANLMLFFAKKWRVNDFVYQKIYDFLFTNLLDVFNSLVKQKKYGIKQIINSINPLSYLGTCWSSYLKKSKLDKIKIIELQLIMKNRYKMLKFLSTFYTFLKK